MFDTGLCPIRQYYGLLNCCRSYLLITWVVRLDEFSGNLLATEDSFFISCFDVSGTIPVSLSLLSATWLPVSGRAEAAGWVGRLRLSFGDTMSSVCWSNLTQSLPAGSTLPIKRMFIRLYERFYIMASFILSTKHWNDDDFQYNNIFLEDFPWCGSWVLACWCVLGVKKSTSSCQDFKTLLAQDQCLSFKNVIKFLQQKYVHLWHWDL